MIKDAENKAINQAGTKREQEYFFPDIDGKQITVSATSVEEAEKKARAIIK